MRVLNERRATGYHYDATMDVARVLVTSAPGTVRTRTVAATLLLDGAGFLVGVDVEPDSPDRAIILLGSHDQVTRTVSTRVGICTDHSHAIFEVRIAGARASIRGNEKNPYV